MSVMALELGAGRRGMHPNHGASQETLKVWEKLLYKYCLPSPSTEREWRSCSLMSSYFIAYLYKSQYNRAVSMSYSIRHLIQRFFVPNFVMVSLAHPKYGCSLCPKKKTMRVGEREKQLFYTLFKIKCPIVKTRHSPPISPCQKLKLCMHVFFM